MENIREYAKEFYALTYDSVVADWPGEIAFYSGLAEAAYSQGQNVLEVACGTGRVAIRLAQAGCEITGLDHSPYMLAVARRKSIGLKNICWIQADMRAFDLDKAFGLVLIPGHSFQNLNTAADQTACLEAIRRDLAPDGRLVLHLDHQDMDWLGSLKGIFEPAGEFIHPQTGRLVRASDAWSYERSTQTAVLCTRWEVLDAEGQVIERIEHGPRRLHAIFRFEVEHLLARSGFEVQALYGDFHRSPLSEESSEMVWVARRA